MSDIDDDLLALADGDSSEDENAIKQSQEPAAYSPDEPDASDDEVAMDESDGEVPGEDDDEEPETSAKYPIEGRYKSEADRKHIMSLPEIEREQILADRDTEIREEVQKKRLAELINDMNRSKKRKASEGGDQDERKTSRQKITVPSARADTLAELRSRRAEKADGRKSSQPKRSRRSETPEDDADAESDNEWTRDKPRRDQTPEEQPTTKKDFDRVKIGRGHFGQVCFYPGFEDAMAGCFVRLSVGPDPNKPGSALYRMAKIESIVEKIPYALPDSNGKMQITTQHVNARWGKTTKEAPFIHCSMGPFEDHEIEWYLAQCRQDNIAAPKKARLIEKTADIHALISHKFTNQEVNEKLGKSKALQDRFKARERERLAKDKLEAEEVGESDKAQRIQERLDNMDKNPVKLGYNTSAGPAKGKTGETPKKGAMTQQQRLGELNRQNLKNDRDIIRKALIEERRTAEKRALAARAAAKKKSSEEAAKGDGVDGKPVHQVFSAKDDLELPYPEWGFDYVDFSNKFLGSRAMRHLAYDEKGRAICDWPREMCDDEVIARMDVPISCIVPEYE